MTTSLVVAIEPDREQAARLSGIVRGRLGAQLVLAESAARALATLGDRIPDLILTPALLPARDEAALAGRLREFGSAAAHVQTITVPRIGGVVADRASRGMFARFRRSRPVPAAPDGCHPDVFAQQVSAYLQRAQTERVSTSPLTAEEPASPPDLYLAPPPAVETFVEPLPVIEELFVAPPLVVELIEPEPGPEPVIETFVAPPPLVEDVIEQPPVVEECVEPPMVIDAFVAPLPIVEEFIEPLPLVAQPSEPAPVQMPVAAAPAIDPIFNVADMDFQFWIEDEPELAPVEAVVSAPVEARVVSAPVEAIVESAAAPDDGGIFLPAPDFGDIDMSALLEGLVLPARPVAVAAAPVELPAPVAPKLQPAPTPRKTLKRHVPVHDHAAIERKLPRLRAKAPIQDEWGLFDPEQCGFAALVAKLDAVTEDEDVERRQGTSARVISYN